MVNGNRDKRGEFLQCDQHRFRRLLEAAFEKVSDTDAGELECPPTARIKPQGGLEVEDG